MLISPYAVMRGALLKCILLLCTQAIFSVGFVSPKSEFLLEIDGNGIALSRGHGCVIAQKHGVDAGGQAKCWGEIYSNADLSDAPEDINFIQIVAGLDFVCGVSVDQAVHCWGAMNGVIPGLFTQISADCQSRFACGIQIDGKIKCWGDGNEDRVVPQISGRFIQVSCSPTHCCALDEKGYPHCWGPSHRNEVNPPTITFKEFKDNQDKYGWVEEAVEEVDEYADDDNETPIVSDDDKRISAIQFRQISVTKDMSCGITLIGAHLRCWGREQLHKRGKWPLAAKGPYRQVSAGGLGVCAIIASEEDLNGDEEELKVQSLDEGRNADALECWGGAKGVLNTKEITAWDQISVGTTHVCGVSMDSQLVCGGSVTPAQSNFFKDVIMA